MPLQLTLAERPLPLRVTSGAKSCLPNAQGVAIDHTFGNVENLQVIISGLPPNTDFVLFIIQVPNAPFGLAWYNGDILTDDTGTGVINVVGRFNVGTFIVSLGAVSSPDVFPAPPAVLANSKTGAVTNGPVQIYHLGVWFNTPDDAVKAGCPGTATTIAGLQGRSVERSAYLLDRRIHEAWVPKSGDAAFGERVRLNRLDP